MIEKRYKVHNIIKGMDVGELVDLELMKELIEEYGAYENMNVEIMNNGKKMTYKEVVDLLNENEQLKYDINYLKGKLKAYSEVCPEGDWVLSESDLDKYEVI